jgi:vacuolar-type H+-ATPase subunit H
MMLLNQYLEELIQKEHISEKQVTNARKDQKDIILEMEKITMDLKDIMK